jgi:hypothetical protein
LIDHGGVNYRVVAPCGLDFQAFEFFASGFDRIPDPVQAACVNCDNVEAADRRALIATQKKLCRKNQAPLFGRCHAGCRPAMEFICSFPDFNEYQRRAVQHDQVNFATLAPEISVKQRQSVLLQVRQRVIFAQSAANLLFGPALEKLE